MARFTMTVGIPGSGKSTWVKKQVDSAEPENIPQVVCPDKLRERLGKDINDQSVNGEVWNLAYALSFDALVRGEDVILDATNCKKSDRVRFLNRIKEAYSSQFQLDETKLELITRAVVFREDVNVAKSRVRQDITKGVNRSNVPMHVIDRMWENFLNGIDKISDEFDEMILVSDE